jgi:hypothetical protein
MRLSPFPSTVAKVLDDLPFGREDNVSIGIPLSATIHVNETERVVSNVSI